MAIFFRQNLRIIWAKFVRVDYRQGYRASAEPQMRINNNPVNLRSIKIPEGNAVPETAMAGFETFKNEMNGLFTVNNFREYASVSR